METLQNSTSSNQSFKEFLFHDRRNRIILYLAAAAIVIQFAIFKYFYPYANYIHGDSFSYLRAANENLTISTYLIGYSKFLRLVSVFSRPDIVLVGLQYLLIQCSTLFFLFTIFYFYKPSRYMKSILLCFMIFNPLFLHLGNLVSSDGLFLSLSMTWFALLLWIIHQPSNRIIFWHALVLFIAFTVRYNSLIYPFIAAFAFWLSKMDLRKKIIGLGFGLLLCGWFIGMSMVQYKKLTGYLQYSPFSGWQMANNALYAFRKVDSVNRKSVPKNFQPLDNMVRKFFDKARRNKTLYPSELAEASTFYMWSSGMPLMDYRDSLFKSKDTTAKEFKKWASMGPIYKDYGLYLIKQYPWHFVQFFIWPNARKYYAPPIEFLEYYNTGNKGVTKQAMQWFGYKSTNVNTRMKNGKVWILDFYPIMSGIINIVMLFGLLYYVMLKGWKYNQVFNKTIKLAGILWFMNAVFTIGASSAALRFQSFPILLTTLFALLMVDWFFQLIIEMKITDNKRDALTEQFSKESIA